MVLRVVCIDLEYLTRIARRLRRRVFRVDPLRKVCVDKVIKQDSSILVDWIEGLIVHEYAVV
jgi:hypothetical protein